MSSPAYVLACACYEIEVLYLVHSVVCYRGKVTPAGMKRHVGTLKAGDCIEQLYGSMQSILPIDR